MERDLSAGTERTVLRRPGLGMINLSPDGRWIATEVDDSAKTSLTLAIVPVAGGEPRALFRVNRPKVVLFQVWAPDSASIMFTRQPATGGDPEWWQVPLQGGEARKLNLGLGTVNRPIRVHPDGRRIAYTAGGNRPSVWVLENFLPSPASK